MNQQEDDSIFSNQKEMIKNLRGSAENLGVNPDQVAKDPDKVEKQAPQEVLVAKRNCKKCYGLGAFTIAGHDVAVRTKEKNNGQPILSTPSDEGTQAAFPQKRGKFIKTNGRNSSQKEPKEKAKAVIYCSCVKLVRVSEPMQTAT
jgi:hypothetical protein